MNVAQVHQKERFTVYFDAPEAVRFRTFLAATGRKAGPYVRLLILAELEKNGELKALFERIKKHVMAGEPVRDENCRRRVWVRDGIAVYQQQGYEGIFDENGANGLNVSCQENDLVFHAGNSKELKAAAERLFSPSKEPAR